MEILSLIKNTTIKVVAFAGLVIGSFFLASEIYDFITLPTTIETEKMYGANVELFKYKENTYSQIFIWSILVLAGVGYWINKKIYWMFSQAFLLMFLLKLELSLLCYQDIRLVPLILYLLAICCFLLFVKIEIELLKLKEIDTISISNNVKLIGVVMGITGCLIYWFLEV